MVPGSLDFKAEQSYLQPPGEQTDIVHVIKGVIEAESGAIEHYNRIIEFCEGRDPVTQDMVITILRDEEGHRRLFEGFLREYKAEGSGLGGLPEASATSTTSPEGPRDHGDHADHLWGRAAVDPGLVHGRVALAAQEQPAVHRVGEESRPRRARTRASPRTGRRRGPRPSRPGPRA